MKKIFAPLAAPFQRLQKAQERVHKTKTWQGIERIVQVLSWPFMPLIRWLDALFFHPMTSKGFGIVRMLWALTILVNMGGRFADVSFFYSDAGLVPTEELGHLVFRKSFRFTLLSWI